MSWAWYLWLGFIFTPIAVMLGVVVFAICRAAIAKAEGSAS